MIVTGKENFSEKLKKKKTKQIFPEE